MIFFLNTISALYVAVAVYFEQYAVASFGFSLGVFLRLDRIR